MGQEAGVVSFPEYTCWNDEDFRVNRKQVVLTLTSVGDRLGQSFDVEVLWDYGIWYHQHDELVIQRLSSVCPAVDWGRLIYHRSWDRWDIDICDPEDDLVVARVEVRQYRGRRLDVLELDLGNNVVRLDDYRTSRLNYIPCEESERLIRDGS